MTHYIMPFLHLLLEMAPYLLLGFLIAGLLHGFVPARLYSRYLAGSTLRSTATAAAIGIPLPLCSCGVIPTAMSLRRNGASKGATVSFLIATPQTGVDSIVATAAMMSLPFAILRPIAALVTAIAGGQLVNRYDNAPGGEAADQGAQMLPKGFWARLRSSLHYGYVEMMQDIGKQLIVGLILAGLIAILIPDNFFASLGGGSLVSMLAVLVIAVPMYVCATGSIPIALALMLKGLTPGAALVFLMAGPATNIAAMMVIGKVLERRALLIYLATIVAGAILFGLAIDWLLPREWFMPDITAAALHDHHNFPWWKIASGVIIVALLFYSLVIARGHSHSHEHEQEQGLHYEVRGMSCGHCRAAVMHAVEGVEGVTGVDVDLHSGHMRVEGTPAPIEVEAAVRSAGYDIERR